MARATRKPVRPIDPILFVREYPVLSQQADFVKHLTVERMKMVLELRELLTGKEEEKSRMRHLYKMAEARLGRDEHWKEEWVHE